MACLLTLHVMGLVTSRSSFRHPCDGNVQPLTGLWCEQVGSPPRDGASELGASTMDLMASHGLRTYAPDLRGLGGTERDEPGFTTPKRCAADLRDVMEFVRSRHPDVSPVLIGWSQGAAVAQLYAQVSLFELNPKLQTLNQSHSCTLRYPCLN